MPKSYPLTMVLGIVNGTFDRITPMHFMADPNYSRGPEMSMTALEQKADALVTHVLGAPQLSDEAIQNGGAVREYLAARAILFQHPELMPMLDTIIHRYTTSTLSNAIGRRDSDGYKAGIPAVVHEAANNSAADVRRMQSIIREVSQMPQYQSLCDAKGKVTLLSHAERRRQAKPSRQSFIEKVRDANAAGWEKDIREFLSCRHGEGMEIAQRMQLDQRGL